MRNLLKVATLCFLFTGICSCTDGPQQADPTFSPRNLTPTFSSSNSPVVVIDEAHHNFLTLEGRYAPFASVLKSDGYTVRANTKPFTTETLQNVNIVVIANALDKSRRDWQPPFEQALSQNEVNALINWVEDGGSLLLIADHVPFPNVVENLSVALGFKFSQGHVSEAIFVSTNETLKAHEITYEKPTPSQQAPSDFQGFTPFLSNSRHIDKVKSFGGSAFQVPDDAISLLTLRQGAVSIEPEVAFQITPETKRRNVAGWSQGAVLQKGQGRVAIFAEGMMFSSQIDTRTGQTFGLRSPDAKQNERFLLNLMLWLSHHK